MYIHNYYIINEDVIKTSQKQVFLVTWTWSLRLFHWPIEQTCTSFLGLNFLSIPYDPSAMSWTFQSTRRTNVLSTCRWSAIKAVSLHKRALFFFWLYRWCCIFLVAEGRVTIRKILGELSAFDLYKRQQGGRPPVDREAEESKIKEHTARVWNIPRVQRLDVPGRIYLDVRSNNWECDAWLKVCSTVLWCTVFWAASLRYSKLE